MKGKFFAELMRHNVDVFRASSGFAANEDGFTLLELTRKHYRDAGPDVRKPDALIR